MTREEILAVAKPILFNTDMVRAIQEDRKSETRRLIKPRYRDDEYGFQVVTCGATGAKYIEKTDENEMGFDSPRYINPQYQAGDYLYVRETWRVGAWDIRHQMIAFDYKDGTCGELVYIHSRDLFNRLVDQSREDARKAKCEYNGVDFVWEKGKSPCRWHPSIHMPKEAARIFLRVTNVWVERLNDVTLDDFLAEGVVLRPEAFNDPENAYLQARKIFSGIWDATISKEKLDKYGWDANPWVWVYRFEKVEV